MGNGPGPRRTAVATGRASSVTLDFHPLADLFPLIEGDAFDELVADVRANGLHQPIIMLDGKILDGRNRYRAALAAELFADENDQGAARYFVDYAEAGGGPLHFVISLNLRRRHLDEGQRAMVAARIATMGQGRPSEWNKSANLPDLSVVKQADAADMLHISERSVRSARKVIDQGAPELVAAVDRGDVSVSAGAAAAELPVREQIELLARKDPKAFAKVAKDKRLERQVEKKDRREERAAELGAKHRALPEVKAGILYIDPAWKDDEVWSDETGMDRAADNQYPTMTLAEIMDLDMGSIAAPDSILLMWCKTNNMIEAFCLAISMGFCVLGLDDRGRLVPVKAASGPRYASALAWDKVIIGTGRWVRDQHEHLLIFRRGKPVAPAPGTQLPSVLTERKTAHSAKPEAILDWIDRVWPNEVKIELNRRGAPRPHWIAWGNEASQPGDDDGEGRQRVGPEDGEQHDEASVPGADGRREGADAGDQGRGAEAARDDRGAGLVAGDLDRKDEDRGSSDVGGEAHHEIDTYNALISADALKGRHTPATAEPIVRAAYAAAPPIPVKQLAEDLGHKLNTVLSWASRFGLSSRDRNRAAMVALNTSRRNAP